MGIALLLLHFALPFALLFSQSVKRNGEDDWDDCDVLVYFVRLIDVFSGGTEFVEVDHPAFSMSWLDVTALIGFGGLWLALFFRSLQSRPFFPLGLRIFKRR